MIAKTPPRLLEGVLTALLDARNQETVAGDISEEYTLVQVVQKGVLRANLWYLRQVISFAAVRIRKGSPVKQLLLVACIFAAAAGLWLAVMENVLRHDGYTTRCAIDICITLQALATSLFLLINARPVFRYIFSAGGVAMLLLGAASILRMLRTPHFEGFVLVIGAALILEGTLTPLVMLRHRSN